MTKEQAESLSYRLVGYLTAEKHLANQWDQQAKDRTEEIERVFAQIIHDSSEKPR